MFCKSDCNRVGYKIIKVSVCICRICVYILYLLNLKRNEEGLVNFPWQWHVADVLVNIGG